MAAAAAVEALIASLMAELARSQARREIEVSMAWNAMVAADIEAVEVMVADIVLVGSVREALVCVLLVCGLFALPKWKRKKKKKKEKKDEEQKKGIMSFYHHTPTTTLTTITARSSCSRYEDVHSALASAMIWQ